MVVPGVKMLGGTGHPGPHGCCAHDIMRGEDKSLEKGIIEGTLPGNRKKRKTENGVDRQCHFMDGTEARRYNPESGQQICMENDDS